MDASIEGDGDVTAVGDQVAEAPRPAVPATAPARDAAAARARLWRTISVRLARAQRHCAANASSRIFRRRSPAASSFSISAGWSRCWRLSLSQPVSRRSDRRPRAKLANAGRDHRRGGGGLGDGRHRRHHHRSRKAVEARAGRELRASPTAASLRWSFRSIPSASGRCCGDWCRRRARGRAFTTATAICCSNSRSRLRSFEHSALRAAAGAAASPRPSTHASIPRTGRSSLSRRLSRRPELPLYEDIGIGNGKAYPEVGSALGGHAHSVVRANAKGETIISVAVPVQRFRSVRGALLLSTLGGDIDAVIATRTLGHHPHLSGLRRRDAAAVAALRRHHRRTDAPPRRSRRARAARRQVAARRSRTSPTGRTKSAIFPARCAT